MAKEQKEGILETLNKHQGKLNIFVLILICCNLVMAYTTYQQQQYYSNLPPYLPENPILDYERSNNQDITLLYSEDKDTILVRILMNNYPEDTQDIISELYTKGYKYEGMYQIDIGTKTSHFITYLVFRKSTDV